jgi:hypothetical protein
LRRSAHSPWFTAQLLAVLCSAGCLLPDYGSPNGGGGEGGASGGGGAGGSAPPVCDGPRPARIWRFGSSNADETVSAIVPLPDGAIVAGEFQGEISYVAGETKSSPDGADGFVMRVDEAGTALWLTAIVVTGDLSLKGARQLPDGAVIVGGEYEGTLSTPIGDVASVGGVDAFVARVSAEGEVTHVAHLGSAEDDQLGGVDVAADGSVVLSLGFTGPALILQEFYTEPSANLAYARLAGEDLSVIHQRVFESPVDVETPFGIAVLSGDRVVITGQYSGTTDFAVPNEPPQAVTFDGFVLVLGLDGVPEWALGFGGGTSRMTGQVVAPLSGGGFLVGGVAHEPASPARFGSILAAEPTNGSSYLWVARVDDDDTVVWVETFSTPAAGITDLTRAVRGLAAQGDVVYLAVAFADAGLLIPTGDELSVMEQASALITLDAATGDPLGHAPIGDALGNAELRDLSVSSCGVFVGGWLSGDLFLPGLGPVAATDEDLLLARFSPGDL